MAISKNHRMTAFFRELMAEPGESLSSTLAGLRESYNDYYVVKQPDNTEM